MSEIATLMLNICGTEELEEARPTPVVQCGTRVLISLWDSLMFGRVPGRHITGAPQPPELGPSAPSAYTGVHLSLRVRAQVRAQVRKCARMTPFALCALASPQATRHMGMEFLVAVARPEQNPRPALVLGYWGDTMRGAVRNKERWKGRRTPTQDPSTNHGHVYAAGPPKAGDESAWGVATVRGTPRWDTAAGAGCSGAGDHEAVAGASCSGAGAYVALPRWELLRLRKLQQLEEGFTALCLAEGVAGNHPLPQPRALICHDLG